MAAKREERRAEQRQGDKREKLALPERIEKRSERMAERATKMNERAAKTKEFAERLKPFYASLSEEQKEVADHVLSALPGGRAWSGVAPRPAGRWVTVGTAGWTKAAATISQMKGPGPRSPANFFAVAA